MSIRQQPIEPRVPAATATAHVRAWEMPANKAYADFSDRLEADLRSLERRFRSFCTANSRAGSLGR